MIDTIHRNKKGLHKNQPKLNTKGETKMNIFTDASITFTKDKKPLFSTHSIILMNEQFQLLDKMAFISDETVIDKAEAQTIMLAIEKAENGSIIYTDSKNNVDCNVALHNMAKEKNITIKWIKREGNAMADLLCSQKRNEMLKFLEKNDETIQGNLPKKRKLSAFNQEFINKSIEKFGMETNQTIEISNKLPKYTFVSDFNKYNKACKKRKGMYSLLKELDSESTKEFENLATVLTEKDLLNMYNTYYKLNVKKEFVIDFSAFITKLGNLKFCVMNTKNNRKVIVDFLILKNHKKEHISNRNFVSIVIK